MAREYASMHIWAKAVKAPTSLCLSNKTPGSDRKLLFLSCPDLKYFARSVRKAKVYASLQGCSSNGLAVGE